MTIKLHTIFARTCARVCVCKTQGGDCNYINEKRQWRGLLSTMELRETQSSFGPLLTHPLPHSPTPLPGCPLQLSRKSSFREEGSMFSVHFPFFVWGSARRGQLGRSRRWRKKGKKEISTSCQERDCLLEMLLPPPYLWKFKHWGVGETVILCFSHQHHPTQLVS